MEKKNKTEQPSENAATLAGKDVSEKVLMPVNWTTLC